MTENIGNNNNNNKSAKTLSAISSALLNDLSRKNLRVFTTRDAASAVSLPQKVISRILSQLYKRGWLGKIRKSSYYLVPLGEDIHSGYTENSLLIASKLTEPYYVGFWTMLHYYGYTEQFSNTVFIASPRRAPNIRLSGVAYQFVSMSEKKFFGFTGFLVNGNPVNGSDKEKTFADCLDRPEYCGGILEAAKALWKAKSELDFQRLLDYLERAGNSAAVKRLGYLAQVLGLQNSIDIKRAKSLVGKGFSKLDPLFPDYGQYNSEWNLRLNHSKNDILAVTRI